MSKRIFTQDQINILLKNKNISKCSSKSITYSKYFKIEAVKQYILGIPNREIFSQAELDANIIGKDQPNECLKRWRKIYKEKGIAGLSGEQRGKRTGIGIGRPRIRGLTDKEKIKRLELTVAYQKEKIDFLAKLWAKRKE